MSCMTNFNCYDFILYILFFRYPNSEFSLIYLCSPLSTFRFRFQTLRSRKWWDECLFAFLGKGVCLVKRGAMIHAVLIKPGHLPSTFWRQFFWFNYQNMSNVLIIHLIFAILTLILLVKRNILILYSYFHRTFMFLQLMSVTFYRCIEKSHNKSFCHVSPPSWKSCWSHIEKSLVASVCKPNCINFLNTIQNLLL